MNAELIPVERIETKIFILRDQKVMLDRDLAALYGVPTKALKRAVMRNIARFPDDFAFVLDTEEVAILRCQIGTSSSWGGTRYMPIRTGGTVSRSVAGPATRRFLGTV
jgi:hypothetical protein